MSGFVAHHSSLKGVRALGEGEGVGAIAVAECGNSGAGHADMCIGDGLAIGIHDITVDAEIGSGGAKNA